MIRARADNSQLTPVRAARLADERDAAEAGELDGGRRSDYRDFVWNPIPTSGIGSVSTTAVEPNVRFAQSGPDKE